MRAPSFEHVDDNDRLQRGEFPEDLFQGLVLLSAPEADPPDRCYELTPDGRPYLVIPEGGDQVFVATQRGYRLYAKGLVRAALRRHWPGLTLTWPPFVEGAPPRPMSPSDLWERYGADADGVYYCYTRETSFRPKECNTGDLYLRVLTHAPPRPVKHREVLEWLGVLLGDRLELFLDWLATCPILDRPTGIPVLRGKGSLGKGMLATGISRYFGVHVVDYDDILKDRFNDALIRGPIVWLDEVSHNAPKSGRFRKLSANLVHSIEGKNTPSGTLIGCPRIFVTCNGPDPFGLGLEELTRDDEEALGIRILLFNCDIRAREWLERRGGQDYTSEWVSYADGSPGKIPELIAWLHQDRAHNVRRGRFLVTGDAEEWAAGLGSRRGLPSSIADAYASWLEVDPARLAEVRSRPFMTDPLHPDVVLVSNQGLREAWRVLLGEDAPSHRAVANALDKMSRKGRERTRLSDRSREWLYHVPEARIAPPDEPEGEE